MVVLLMVISLTSAASPLDTLKSKLDFNHFQHIMTDPKKWSDAYARRMTNTAVALIGAAYLRLKGIYLIGPPLLTFLADNTSWALAIASSAALSFYLRGKAPYAVASGVVAYAAFMGFF